METWCDSSSHQRYFCFSSKTCHSVSECHIQEIRSGRGLGWKLSADICQITYKHWKISPAEDGNSSEKLFMIVVGDFLPRLSELWPLNMSLLVSKSYLFFLFSSLAGNFSLRSANSSWKLFILSFKVNGGLQDNKATKSQQNNGHGPAFSCAKESSCTTLQSLRGSVLLCRKATDWFSYVSVIEKLSTVQTPAPNLCTWIHLMVF